MNRSSIAAGVTMSALFLMPLVAVAAVKAPAVEPNSGFTTGSLPAWASRHASSGSIEHREFHKQMVENLGIWKEENKRSLGTEEYTQSLRVFLVGQGQEHRTYHHWQDETDAERAWRAARKNMVNPFAPRAVTTPVTNPTPADLLAESDFTPIFAEHRYEGSKPSSRLMAEQARVRGLNR